MQLKNASILIVDDDPDVLTAVKLLLKPETKQVVVEKNPENIPSLLNSHHFDVIFLDMNFKSSINTGNEGFYWLNKIKSFKKDALVVMITAYGDIDLAIRSLKEGAADFVLKPWKNDKLISTLNECLKGKEKSLRKDDLINNSELIGESNVMLDILFKIRKIAPTDANILILGENGTGKDLIANAIHQESLRFKKKIVKVDVGALSDSLFESELFGYKKGAFTDAREDRMGRFEFATGGTLFLDEIGNISLQQQAKLLSVLQNRQVIPLGSNDVIPIDIRLICATNLPLYELANENRFRKDLIYRINTVEIIVPPLRDRGNDIILLARHFVKVYAEKYSKASFSWDEKALLKLVNYSYPGNVRELQYMIERAVIMAEGAIIHEKDIFFSPIESSEKSNEVSDNSHLNTLEKSTILKVINKYNGNITKSAGELGITRTALYRRISKYDL